MGVLRVYTAQINLVPHTSHDNLPMLSLQTEPSPTLIYVLIHMYHLQSDDTASILFKDKHKLHS